MWSSYGAVLAARPCHSRADVGLKMQVSVGHRIAQKKFSTICEVFVVVTAHSANKRYMILNLLLTRAMFCSTKVRCAQRLNRRGQQHMHCLALVPLCVKQA